MASPQQRFIPRFAAEPPQEALPYGRWAQRLAERLAQAWSTLDADGEDLGEPGEIVWYPDRGWHGQRYVPATAMTSRGYELYGYVRFTAGANAGEPGASAGEPGELSAQGDFTAQTAESNPQWRLDICDQPIGLWHGRGGATATMTLVWGRPLVGGGCLATAELGGVTVDQCELIEQRFTLIAPDDYQHDLLEVGLWDAKGRELARESLYESEPDGA